MYIENFRKIQIRKEEKVNILNQTLL